MHNPNRGNTIRPGRYEQNILLNNILNNINNMKTTKLLTIV